MENRKINLISTVDATVSIDDPQVRFSRTWERKGTIRQVDFDTLRELSYNRGVWNMLRKGILYIDDMEAKIELGLESPDAKEPENIIVLSDAQRKRYLTVMPVAEFKQNCTKLGSNELNNLVDYAIDNEIINYDKATILKQLTNRDIIKAVELNRADKND